MKRILVIAALVLGLAAAASAQPRAIGGRLGYGLEASYQHSLGENFIQADLGLFSFSSLNVTGTYNIMLAKPEWTSRGTWGFYAGPGASLGLDWGYYASKAYYKAVANWDPMTEKEPVYRGGTAFTIAVAGMVGLEYTFWFPLQLSVDLRPQLGIAISGNGVAFHDLGLYGLVPTLSARYTF